MKGVIGSMVIGIICGAAICQGIIHFYLEPKQDTSTDSIVICGTIEQPDSEIPGHVHVTEFERVLDADGVVFSVNNSVSEQGTTLRVRICDERSNRLDWQKVLFQER